jgi:hypothetical protein
LNTGANTFGVLLLHRDRASAQSSRGRLGSAMQQLRRADHGARAGNQSRKEGI